MVYSGGIVMLGVDRWNSCNGLDDVLDDGWDDDWNNGLDNYLDDGVDDGLRKM